MKIKRKGNRAGIRKANTANVRDSYINEGLTYIELQLKYHIGHATVARYLKENGGLTIEDQINHLRNKKEVKS